MLPLQNGRNTRNYKDFESMVNNFKPCKIEFSHLISISHIIKSIYLSTYVCIYVSIYLS